MTIGSVDIVRSISGVSTSAVETPRKRSAPCSASASVVMPARGGEFTFDFVDIRTVSRDHAAAVAEDHVLTADAYGDEQPCAGDGRGPGAVDHHAEFVERLAGDLYGIEHRGGRDDGRAVLVVVHHGNIQFFAQPPVDFEAFRGFDVLEVDAPECRGYRFHRADECLGIGFVDFDVEGVDVGVSFEEHAFTFHDGLACQSSDIAQSQDGPCRSK